MALPNHLSQREKEGAHTTTTTNDSPFAKDSSISFVEKKIDSGKHTFGEREGRVLMRSSCKKFCPDVSDERTKEKEELLFVSGVYGTVWLVSVSFAHSSPS